jgi:hypothetical protein
MAYATIVNGTDLFVFIGSAPIGHATNYTLNMKMNTRDVSSKDSGTITFRDAGRLDITATCEGLIAYGSFEDIATKMIARAPLLTVFGRKNTGAETPCTSGSYASGYFFVTDWTETAPDQGNATYSVSFEHCSGFVFTSGSGA